MRKRAPDWTIAGLGPLLVIACAVGMISHVAPEVVLGGLALSVVVLIIAAEFAT